MSSLRIYNTLDRQLQDFQPIEPGKVRMYVCGITVYDLCHMGHARMNIAFDIVYRWLQASGYDVTYVRNITDIDDKIIRRALERGITIGQLTSDTIAAMHRDFDALGIAKPTHEPRATEYVPQMLDIIGKLETKGLAYQADGGGDVNYAVRKFDGYGKLSGKSPDQLRAGERVAVDDGKRDPLDFVLWKSAKAEEPAEAKWASPWGEGRPGWHIECSAMSCALLGERFDIHGGGMDLQFPHHENEIAQSEGAFGHFVNYWLHNGFLNIDGEKMSKSLGNFFTIQEVLEKFDGESIRFFMLRTQYRSPFNFSDLSLDDARTALRRLYTALDAVVPADVTIDWTQGPAAAFKAAMDDDFNTPGALAVLFELANQVNRDRSAQDAGLLKALGGVLGVLQQAPKTFLQAGAGLDEAAIDAQIAARAAAKASRDFAEADRIRKSLAEQGIELKDSATGTAWVRVSKVGEQA
jgi:cysteinyl-tRNA synthetase